MLRERIAPQSEVIRATVAGYSPCFVRGPSHRVLQLAVLRAAVAARRVAVVAALDPRHPPAVAAAGLPAPAFALSKRQSGGQTAATGSSCVPAFELRGVPRRAQSAAIVARVVVGLGTLSSLAHFTTTFPDFLLGICIELYATLKERRDRVPPDARSKRAGGHREGGVPP